jgi:flagellar biosynthesis chaperone FliJ
MSEMRDEPLTTLLRLRRLALDDARLALAACVAAESDAALALRAIQESIHRETALAGRLDAGDAAVEAFSAWLRRCRGAHEAAAERLDGAEERTHEARVVLAASRAAVEAIEEEIARRDRERQRLDQRMEQRSLDEIRRDRRN